MDAGVCRSNAFDECSFSVFRCPCSVSNRNRRLSGFMLKKTGHGSWLLQPRRNMRVTQKLEKPSGTDKRRKREKKTFRFRRKEHPRRFRLGRVACQHKIKSQIASLRFLPSNLGFFSLKDRSIYFGVFWVFPT